MAEFYQEIYGILHEITVTVPNGILYEYPKNLQGFLGKFFQQCLKEFIQQCCKTFLQEFPLDYPK